MATESKEKHGKKHFAKTHKTILFIVALVLGSLLRRSLVLRSFQLGRLWLWYDQTPAGP